MSEGQKRKRSKGWYRKQAFLNKRMKTGHRLAAGQRGFIITCNEHEKDAVKEAYNILNEYADKLYGPEEKPAKAATDSSDDEDAEEDIEKAIANEVQSLKDTAQTERRFQNCLTGARNCIFIKTTIADPTHLAHAVFSDLLQTKVQKSRHALRLLPVVGTCKGNLKSIISLAEEVLVPFFTDTKLEITYTIMFKARNNNGVGREMTISSLRSMITEKFPSVLTRFTSSDPQLTILIEVMCGVACIAVARDFNRFRKYNLVEVVNERPSAPEKVDDDNESKADSKAEGTDSLAEKSEERTLCETDTVGNNSTLPQKNGNTENQSSGFGDQNTGSVTSEQDQHQEPTCSQSPDSAETDNPSNAHGDATTVTEQTDRKVDEDGSVDKSH